MWNSDYCKVHHSKDYGMFGFFKRKMHLKKWNGQYVFHTHFAEEFRSASIEGIIEQLYENSRKGMGNIEFEDWWAYQQSVWRKRYGIRVPDQKSPQANEKLLEVLLRVGALLEGPLTTAVEGTKS